MPRRAIASLVACGLMSLVLIFDLSTEMAAADKATTDKSPQAYNKPIRNPKFIPTADQVDLFDAVEAGQVTVRLIPKNAMGGNVLIENKTDKPLTVKIPEAVAGISIHAQFGNFGFGNQANANQGLANGPGGKAQQIIAGGINQFQANGPGQGNPQGPPVPPGFFSIPAEKIVSLPLISVCLEHGKPEPTSGSKYTLVPVSRVSRDPVLYQLLAIVGTGKVDPKAAQAAAWHLTNKMSFQELAEKINTPLGALTSTTEFSRDQILAAQELVAQAKQKDTVANAAGTAEPKSEPDTKFTRTARIVAN